VGAFLLGASMIPFAYNLWKSRNSPLVNIDDPWGWGRSLEWATSSPPPRHNFVTLPRIRSESPAFDLHHPEIAALDAALDEDHYTDSPDVEGRREHLEDVKRGQGRADDNPTIEDKERDR
jgi:cytochrome c oxidase subunit 1